MKYVLLDEISQNRTAKNMQEHFLEALHVGCPVKGVKSKSVLSDLQHFIIASGFVPDSMHAVNLGLGE